MLRREKRLSLGSSSTKGAASEAPLQQDGSAAPPRRSSVAIAGSRRSWRPAGGGKPSAGSATDQGKRLGHRPSDPCTPCDPRPSRTPVGRPRGRGQETRFFVFLMVALNSSLIGLPSGTAASFWPRSGTSRPHGGVADQDEPIGERGAFDHRGRQGSGEAVEERDALADEDRVDLQDELINLGQ